MSQHKHQNNGSCPKCIELMDKYSGLNPALRDWFVKFQIGNPIFHISCAGRGYVDQEKAKFEKRSRAAYGESAHNYNCAIDLFIDSPGVGLYDKELFIQALYGKLPEFLNWYGYPGSEFFELPHIEIKAWKNLLASGFVQLVEPLPNSTEVA